MSEEQTYTVVSVFKNEERPDKGYGPMRSIDLTFAEFEGQVNWYTKAATAAPAPGDTLTGTIETGGQYEPKFKKAKPQGGFGGGGGFRPEDPERQRKIIRQHSQTTAIATVRLMHDLGIPIRLDPDGPGGPTAGLLIAIRVLTDHYDHDVQGTAPPAAGNNSRVLSDKQVDYAKSLIKRGQFSDADVDGLRKHFGVASLEFVPADRADELFTRLKQKEPIPANGSDVPAEAPVPEAANSDDEIPF